MNRRYLDHPEGVALYASDLYGRTNWAFWPSGRRMKIIRQAAIKAVVRDQWHSINPEETIVDELIELAPCSLFFMWSNFLIREAILQEMGWAKRWVHFRRHKINLTYARIQAED